MNIIIYVCSINIALKIVLIMEKEQKIAKWYLKTTMIVYQMIVRKQCETVFLQKVECLIQLSIINFGIILSNH